MPAILAIEELNDISRAIVDTVLIKDEGEIGLKFASQAESKKLNKRYAGNNYATDVLSFAYEGSGLKNIGDIVVCTELAKTQAKQYGMSHNAELSLLIVHGALHLLNYDHQTEQDASSMDWLQSAIMKTLNKEYRDFQWLH